LKLLKLKSREFVERGFLDANYELRAASVKCVLIYEGNIKVRWLAALAVRSKEEDVAEDVHLLPADFPRREDLQHVANTLGASASEFSNWFPNPAKRQERKNSEQVNRPRVEFTRNLARMFGFAPDSDDDGVWRDWWKNDWPSFMPSEENKTNARDKTPAEDFKARYREELKNGRLTFRPLILVSPTPTSEEGPGVIVTPSPPTPHEQAGTDIPGPRESAETPPQPLPRWQPTKWPWPIFLLSAVILVACGYAIAGLWQYVYYPTVDLVRTINFSELACNAESNKHDVAYLYDDYTLVWNLFRFKTYVKVADLRGKGFEDFSVDVYDLNSDPSRKIVAIHSDTNSERRLQSYALTVENSHVRAKWVWRNAHSEPIEGTAVTGGWVLRDLTVNYTLPTGRDITTIGKITPAVAGRNCQPRQNSIYCPALYTTDEVQIWWDWNVWNGCKH
jgi:hypothetical protein